MESSSSSSDKNNELDHILNQSSNMSESLLYCMDGNQVSQTTPDNSTINRKRQLDEESKDSSNESIKRPLIEVEQEADSEDYTEL